MYNGDTIKVNWFCYCFSSYGRLFAPIRLCWTFTTANGWRRALLMLRLLQLLSIYTALVGAEVVEHFLRALIEDFLRPFHASNAKIDISSIFEKLWRWRCHASRSNRHSRASLCIACPANCIGQTSTSGVERFLITLSKRRAQGGHRAAQHVLRGEER